MITEQRHDHAARRDVPALPVTKAWRFVKGQVKLAKLFDEMAQLKKSESSAHGSDVLHAAISGKWTRGVKIMQAG
ncbi:hypothetical protein NY406_04850 [Chlorobaculum sp. MV4-Y]|jgi:hypothetical protein|nr:hypothetical protein [Chlorobaculum sp. MV4-Y]UWX58595.1 hypothetical protein NY406_04850 [Chlorobaculum sp. MV4-Y]